MSKTTAIFAAFEAKNVLIIGDVMIDRYLTGKVHRISPEAPVPVVHLSTRDNRLGGAANVALNIKALGATPYLCSLVGDDDNAHAFLDLLPHYELPDDGMLRSKDRVTTVKTRVIAANQQMLRVDTEDTHDLTAKEYRILIERITHILDTKNIHVILFQDYNKGVLSEELIAWTVQEAKKRTIITVVDPKKRNFLAYKEVSLFKPNLKEVQEGLPIAVGETEAALKMATEYIRKQLNNKYTMITLSERGLFISDGVEHKIIGTQARNVADVCGAGDTVISVAALGLALDLDMSSIATLANLAGGQVCEKVGVVPVDKIQLQREYERISISKE